jgi:hypothetical protein
VNLQEGFEETNSIWFRSQKACSVVPSRKKKKRKKKRRKKKKKYKRVTIRYSGVFKKNK